MPLGDIVNQIPAPVFLVIHLAIFAVAAYFAWRSFEADAGLLGWGFSLFAVAEISYMTYHLDWTIFLFAHTISEVLVLGGIVLTFAGVARVLGAAVSEQRL